jgi:hypothetical protein
MQRKGLRKICLSIEKGLLFFDLRGWSPPATALSRTDDSYRASAVVWMLQTPSAKSEQPLGSWRQHVGIS